MDKKETIQFVKDKLSDIIDSDDAKFSAGIADTLLSLINKAFSETVEITITGVRDNNLINAIKTVRSLTNFGLKEAKDAVELRQTILKTTDIALALKWKKELEHFCTLKIDGGGEAMKVLF